VVFLILPVVVLFALYPGPVHAVAARPLNQGGIQAPVGPSAARAAGERGDVPGWVLITAMTWRW
jgi:hypothetical protein